ncbi:MAG: PAS domain S-box protein [Candidatus Nanopelagicales bacterium]
MPEPDFDGLTPIMDRLFPFHCVLDVDLHITSAGSTLPKLVGQDPVGCEFTELFEPVTLFGTLTAEQLRRLAGQLFVATDRRRGMRLRGQVIADHEGERFLVAWSPWIGSTAEFEEAGFTLSDYGVQDPIVDMLHLLQAYQRAQAEAVEPLLRLERFFDISPDLMLIAGRDGQIRQANHACERLFGVGPAELVGTNIRQWIRTDAPGELARALAELADGSDEVFTLEMATDSPSHGERALQWSAIGDPGGSLVFATARDMSAAGEARSTATRILASAPNAMIVVDPAGLITYVNTAAGRLFDYPDDELVGTSIEMLVPDELRRRHVKLRHRFTEQGSGDGTHTMAISTDVVGITRRGRRVPLQVSLSTIALEGQPHTLAAIVDISASKALEEELVSTRDAAVALAQAKSDLLANTSHEIRTPLASVIGLTELLLDTDLDDDQRQLVGTAHMAGERLLALVNDILNLARGEASKLMVDETVFPPAELTEECARIVAPVAREKDIAVTVDVLPTTPEFVVGDREKLRAVILNLAGNAVKFTAEGSVRLRVGREADELFVEVADTGVGFDEAKLDSLFQPFVQADASTTRKYGGSGLGLAITKQLVDVLGGCISASSAIGEGTTFRVSVPMPVAARPEPAAPGDLPSDGSLAGLRVLLVEDDLVNSTMIARMLGRLAKRLRT